MFVGGFFGWLVGDHWLRDFGPYGIIFINVLFFGCLFYDTFSVTRLCSVDGRVTSER